MQQQRVRLHWVKHRPPLVTAAAAGVLWAAGLSSHSSGHVIAGVVEDGVSGSPVAGARVSAGRGLIASTNASGQFVLTGITADRVALEATKVGFFGGRYGQL